MDVDVVSDIEELIVGADTANVKTAFEDLPTSLRLHSTSSHFAFPSTCGSLSSLSIVALFLTLFPLFVVTFLSCSSLFFDE